MVRYMSLFLKMICKCLRIVLSWIGENSIPFIGLNLVFISMCDILIRPELNSFILYKIIQFVFTLVLCGLVSWITDRYLPWMVGKSK